MLGGGLRSAGAAAVLALVLAGYGWHALAKAPFEAAPTGPGSFPVLMVEGNIDAFQHHRALHRGHAAHILVHVRHHALQLDEDAVFPAEALAPDLLRFLFKPQFHPLFSFSLPSCQPCQQLSQKTRQPDHIDFHVVTSRSAATQRPDPGSDQQRSQGKPPEIGRQHQRQHNDEPQRDRGDAPKYTPSSAQTNRLPEAVFPTAYAGGGLDMNAGKNFS